MLVERRARQCERGAQRCENGPVAVDLTGTLNPLALEQYRVSTHVTRALVAVLCELAADAEPDSVSMRLAATPAAGLEPTDGPLTGVNADTPVLSDFYFPDAGKSLSSVFGVDLAAPTGQTAGRFVSHPNGDPSVGVTDDLHATVLVAVPPWEVADLRAYDRHGNRLDLVFVDAETPKPDTKV